MIASRWLAVMIFVCLSVSSATTAQAQTILFFDTTYSPQDWSTVTLAAPFPSTGSAIQGTYTAGGEYYEVTHSLGGNPSPANVATFHMKQDATYWPALQGPIVTLDYSEYISILQTEFGTYGAATAPALLQGGSYYIANLTAGRTDLFGALPSPWLQDQRSGLTASNFSLVTGPGTLDFNQHPNFGPTGSPINFGSVVRNTHTFSFTSTRICAKDDFHVLLYTNPICSPLSNLICTPNSALGQIQLNWSVGSPLPGQVQVWRDGFLVTTLFGSITQWTDVSVGPGVHAYTLIPICAQAGSTVVCTTTLLSPVGCPAWSQVSTQLHVVIPDPFGPDTLVIDNNAPWSGAPIPPGTIIALDQNPAVTVIRFTASTTHHTITATAADIPMFTGRHLTLTKCDVTRTAPGGVPMHVCVSGRNWTAIGPMLGRNFLFGWGNGPGDIDVTMEALIPGVGTVVTSASAPTAVPRAFSVATPPYLVPAGIPQLKMHVSFDIETIGTSVRLPYSADIFLGDTSEVAVIWAAEGANGAVDSVSALKSALEANGELVLVVPNLESAGNPKSLWCCMGTYPANRALSMEEGEILSELAVAGVPIYIEGADVWGFDAPTPFSDYDGVQGTSDTTVVADGDDSLHGLYGSSFGAIDLSNFEATYLQDNALGNDFTDRLQASTTDVLGSNAGPIWSDDGSGGSTNAYDVGILYQTNVPGVVISSSFEFGGIAGDQIGIIALYLAAFNPIPACPGMCGDMDSNGLVNITDAINLLFYLFLAGPPPADGPLTADVSGNGAIDLLDALVLLTYLFLGGDMNCAGGC